MASKLILKVPFYVNIFFRVTKKQNWVYLSHPFVTANPQWWRSPRLVRSTSTNVIQFSLTFRFLFDWTQQQLLLLVFSYLLIPCLSVVFLLFNILCYNSLLCNVSLSIKTLKCFISDSGGTSNFQQHKLNSSVTTKYYMTFLFSLFS